ncbi:MAG: hypothetical protein AAGA56_07555 [Myxococcota bacterium]
MGLPSDLIDLLAVFAAHGVEYLLIGGQAVALHGHPRFTKDADIWLRDSTSNLNAATTALVAFGARRPRSPRSRRPKGSTSFGWAPRRYVST